MSGFGGTRFKAAVAAAKAREANETPSVVSQDSAELVNPVLKDPEIPMSQDVEEEEVPQTPLIPTQVPEASLAMVLAQLSEAIKQMSAARPDSNTDTAVKQVELIERLVTKTHPENIEHGHLSVYSHPEGDVANPKTPLKCKMSWVGYFLNTDMLTPLEVDLFNRLQPGEYKVTKADGTGIPFRVHARFSDRLDDLTGKPTVESLDITFPCKGDHRQNHMSMVSYLQQVLGDRIPTIDEAMKELSRLRSELDATRIGAAV